MAPYFQDVYDHVLRVGEWTDSLRDLLANILETRLTIRSNRINVIMKKVTSWAAIIAVPTAVTGYYGMNVPYPGFQQQLGRVDIDRPDGGHLALALCDLQAQGLALNLSCKLAHM